MWMGNSCGAISTPARGRGPIKIYRWMVRVGVFAGVASSSEDDDAPLQLGSAGVERLCPSCRTLVQALLYDITW